MALKVNNITNKAGTGAPEFDYGIKGRTDGVAIPAGSVGEVLEDTSTSNESLGDPGDLIWTDTARSISLTAGVWRIEVQAWLQLSVSGATALAEFDTRMAIRTGSTVVNGSEVGQTHVLESATAPKHRGTTLTTYVYVNISSTTVYKLSARRAFFGGASTGTISINVRGDRGETKLTATRIA